MRTDDASRFAIFLCGKKQIKHPPANSLSVIDLGCAFQAGGEVALGHREIQVSNSLCERQKPDLVVSAGKQLERCSPGRGASLRHQCQQLGLANSRKMIETMEVLAIVGDVVSMPALQNGRSYGLDPCE